MSKNLAMPAWLRPFRLLMATAVAAASGTALIASPAMRPPHPSSIPATPTYVALGSSYAAVAGIGAADPTDRCGRSTLAYASLVADTLDLQLTNAGCGGASIPKLRFHSPADVES